MADLFNNASDFENVKPKGADSELQEFLAVEKQKAELNAQVK